MHKQKIKILVLIAIKDGEKFLQEQLDSILLQHDVEVNLLLSIDESNDKSLNICKTYAYKNKNITILPHKKFGSPAKNFFRLINDCKNINNFNYVALSDQDDIWLPNKLISAVSCLNKFSASGYSSNVEVLSLNKKNSFIKKSHNQKKYDYYFEAPGPGCTFVLALTSFISLKNFIKNNFNEIEKILYHDWFIYAYYRAKNFTWIIDNNSYILYRSHDNNYLGPNNSLKALKKRLLLILSGQYKEQIKIIYKQINKINTDKLIFSKKNLILNFSQFRRSKLNQFLTLLLILLNLI